eukprot:CAMPEP_0182899652 /NCGR_PEP_ID=MMETSP0034_2-20130328/28188_1 /TAXON_ID=156128 /ORGANISM="Nephroselmis pyriformis, Strain CCMP717" /LENGTH=161 /DNA_ID=CAMNT_0025033691 /DNA_START=125 /DNA_END=607 /DNA_ORIENTATION=-
MGAGLATPEVVNSEGSLPDDGLIGGEASGGDERWGEAAESSGPVPRLVLSMMAVNEGRIEAEGQEGQEGALPATSPAVSNRIRRISAPGVAKEGRFGAESKSRYAVKEVRCKAEDRYLVDARPGDGKPWSSAFGVFDGHGGGGAAEFCKEKLLGFVVEELR